MRKLSQVKVIQSEKYEGDDWWSWAVSLDGPKRELDQIDYVEYTLHPTFPQPVRRVDSRAENFRLATAGWGVFPIYARIVRKDGTQARLRHQLKLTYPDGKRNLA